MPKSKHRLPGKIRKSKVPAILVGLLIVAAIIAAIGARPLGRAFKNSRAQSLVTEARALNSEGRVAPAFEKARKAFELAPDHPEVMRLLGLLMKDNPQTRDNASYFLKELARREEANHDDKINLAGIYLAEGQESEARKLLAEVEAKEPAHAGAVALRSRLDGTAAITGAAAAISPKATANLSPSERLELARAQLSGNDRQLLEQASETLWELAQEDHAIALMAMEILASASRISRARGTQLKELLEKHEEATDRHLLIAKSLEIRMNPSRSDQIVAEEVKMRLGKPIAELNDFLNWLLRENQAGWVLDLIPEEVAKKSPQTLAYHVEALSREAQWEKLDLLLLDGDLPLKDAQRILLQARCAKALEKPEEEVRNLLKNAMNASARAGDFRSVAAATQMAQNSRFHEVGQLGLSILVTSPAWKETALLGYYKIAADDFDSSRMLETAKDVLQENPNNERFQHIVSYLSLLKGREIELASNTANELIAKSGSRPDRTLLKSLADLRLGNFEGAANACQNLDPTDLRPGPRAIYATILRRAGQSVEATKVARKIPRPLLLPEEKEMLAWLR